MAQEGTSSTKKDANILPQPIDFQTATTSTEAETETIEKIKKLSYFQLVSVIQCVA